MCCGGLLGWMHFAMEWKGKKEWMKLLMEQTGLVIAGREWKKF